MNRDDCCGSGLAIASFLAGAVVGAGIALLVAPRTGRETRERLAEYGSDFREKLVQVPQEVKEQAEEMIERGQGMVDRGKEILKKGASAVSQGKEYLGEKKKILASAIEAGKEAMQREKEALASTFQLEEE